MPAHLKSPNPPCSLPLRSAFAPYARVDLNTRALVSVLVRDEPDENGHCAAKEWLMHRVKEEYHGRVVGWELRSRGRVLYVVDLPAGMVEHMLASFRREAPHRPQLLAAGRGEWPRLPALLVGCPQPQRHIFLVAVGENADADGPRFIRLMRQLGDLGLNLSLASHVSADVEHVAIFTASGDDRSVAELEALHAAGWLMDGYVKHFKIDDVPIKSQDRDPSMEEMILLDIPNSRPRQLVQVLEPVFELLGRSPSIYAAERVPEPGARHAKAHARFNFGRRSPKELEQIVRDAKAVAIRLGIKLRIRHLDQYGDLRQLLNH